MSSPRGTYLHVKSPWRDLQEEEGREENEYGETFSAAEICSRESWPVE